MIKLARLKARSVLRPRLIFGLAGVGLLVLVWASSAALHDALQRNLGFVALTRYVLNDAPLSSSGSPVRDVRSLNLARAHFETAGGACDLGLGLVEFFGGE